MGLSMIYHRTTAGKEDVAKHLIGLVTGLTEKVERRDATEGFRMILNDTNRSG